MKKFIKALDTALSSKIVWFNFVMTAIAISAYLETFLPNEVIPYSTLVQGIGTIILRIWFTEVTKK